jgi:hypothetical protein
MNSRWLFPILLFLPLFLNGCPQDTTPATGYGYWQPDSVFATDLQNEQKGSNGIEVGEPKIYDDSSLKMMLDQARQRLAAINGLNESALVSHLGAVTGSTMDQTQFGIQVGPAGLPSVATTATGPTTSTTTNSGLPAGQTSLPASTTVATNPSQSVVTTTTPPSSPIPTVPSGLAYTPPSTMSGSALDVLNEEMQLTYETANLQLLLEGALSDRFVKNQRIIKPRTTMGFPITIKPQSRYKNAVAVVEVEVETAPRNLASNSLPEPPSVTALLPQEKTYNVAAIKDHMTSIGAGAVVNAISIGGTWVTGRKTYYVVQDQDTVAIERPADPSKPRTTSFAWEFRPVLGEQFVRGGLKQTFVQLALPIPDQDCYGSIRVRTYWSHFDQKNGIVKEPIADSILSRGKLSIPHYDLTPQVDGVSYQDLGDGTVLVAVQGSFLAGTYVQLGVTRFDTTKGLLVEESGLKFVAPAAALARWTAKVVSRDGKQTSVLYPLAQKPLRQLDQFSCAQDNPPKGAPAPAAATAQIQDIQISPNRDKVQIAMQRAVALGPNPPAVSLVDNRTQARLDIASSVATGFDGDSPLLTARMDANPPCPYGSIVIKKLSLKPINENDSELSVEFQPVKPPMTNFPDDVLLDIGHKVFGLADTVVKRDSTATAPTITAIVPTALLVAARKVRAFRMFWTNPDDDSSGRPRSDCFDKSENLSDFDFDSAVERLMLVSVDADGKATYLLYGNGLKDVKILVPKDTKDAKVAHVDNVGQDRIAMIEITKDGLKQTKKLVLQKADKERPLVLDLPQPDGAGPKVSLDSPVIQNTDEMDVSIDKVEDLVSVKMGEKELKYTPGKDMIRLKNLRADGVTSQQKTQELIFEFKDKTKVKVKLEVVAARVGVK